LIADCSSGIEPLFAPIYIRRISDGDHLLEVNHNFVINSQSAGFYNEVLFQKLAAGVNAIGDKQHTCGCQRSIRSRI